MADTSQHYTRELADELRKSLREDGHAASRDLALPEDPQDGRNVGHAAFVRSVREDSLRDPMYLAKMLDQLAPVAVTLPDGKKLRSETGLRNYHALVKEARPDVYLAAVLTEQPAGAAPVESPGQAGASPTPLRTPEDAGAAPPMDSTVPPPQPVY